jgi:hypothetical protein
MTGGALVRASAPGSMTGYGAHERVVTTDRAAGRVSSSREKRFTCDFPGCAYAAKQKAHLDKHMKSHNDARAGVRLVIGGAQPTVEPAATIKKPAWNRRRGEV